MAENPVVTLTRLLAGVVLMQGRLGHQVLGQLLVAGSSDVAVAGASVVVAATARQRNAVAQVALRTAAPTLATRLLLRKQEKRIDEKQTRLAEQQRRLEQQSQAIERRERELKARHGELEAQARRSALGAESAAKIEALEERTRELESELERSKQLPPAEKPRRRARSSKKKR